VGARAQVLDTCAPDGRVRLGGEIWNARSEVRAERGQTVRIQGIDGLTLLVEPLRPAA
jgi:membrane-bound serine protease (ClpP class)